MNLSAPGILEDALIQLLEEVVHPYHISPEEHDNLEYRLLVSLPTHQPVFVSHL